MKHLNILFILHVIVVGLVLIGIIPREAILIDTAALLIYLLFIASLEDGLIFFVRSIPLFIALPLTATYDNLNMWRVFALALGLRWILQRETWHYLGAGIILLIKHPKAFAREHSWLVSLVGLLILATASLSVASDPVTGLKRIIYFLNAGLIGAIIAYPPRSKEFSKRLVLNITVPVIIVALVGAAQVISTYFIDIYQFMRIWGEGIQLREFGTLWSYIAVHVGNTWFAYFGDQLSLRVFSLFPDSHSFPIFLLLGLPAFFAWTLVRPISASSRLRTMLHTRGKLAVLWIPLIFLMMILSGTRGIWLGGVLMLAWVPLLLLWLRIMKGNREHRNIITYLGSYVLIFFLLFAVAYPIFSSPQFLVSKGNSALLERRFKSILDFGETSNSQRLEIWKKSAISIEHHAALGVGIGNFPVVLDQNIQLSKAGSSAHNIYLHVGAEMGVVALAVFLFFLWLVLSHMVRQFMNSEDAFHQAYFGGLLITLPWILAYLMTDVAIFDERTLLLTAITLALSAHSIKHRHV